VGTLRLLRFVRELVLEDIFDQRFQHALCQDVVKLRFEFFKDFPHYRIHGFRIHGGRIAFPRPEFTQWLASRRILFRIGLLVRASGLGNNKCIDGAISSRCES